MTDVKMKPREILKLLKRLYGYTKEYLFGWGLIRWIGGFGSSALNLFYSKIMGGLIDVVVSQELELLIRFILTLSSIVLIRSALGYSNSLSHYRYCVQSGRKLRKEGVKKINSLPPSYFEQHHTGEVISRIMNDIEYLQEFYGNSIAGIWSFVPSMLITGSIILMGINVKLTLICLAIVPIVTYFLNKINLPVGDASLKMQESQAIYNSHLRDYIEGVSIYKIFGMKKKHTAKFNAACDEIAGQSYKIAIRQSLGWAVSSISTLFPWVFAYAIGGLYVSRGEMTIGQLYTFASVLGPFTGAFWKISQSWSEMVIAAGKAKHYFRLMDETSERSDGNDFSAECSATAFEFKEVDFSYREGDPILQHCSFKVEQGKKTALVGASGCGKSTAFRLICGYYNDYSGQILINGHELSEWSLTALRKSIAYVSQEVYLFDDTIMENIRMGSPEATDEEVIEAAKKAYAHEFILETDNAYQTRLGERGIRLSGGQCQRISIARAILKDAPVIILDEPTSALDAKSEVFVQKALENLEQQKTVFVIAHRLSTIENASNILVLENGCLCEEGSHEALLQGESRYHALYRSQIAEGGEYCDA